MTIPLPFIHLWRYGKWAGGTLDARACRICGRYEIWAYGTFRKTDKYLDFTL